MDSDYFYVKKHEYVEEFHNHETELTDACKKTKNQSFPVFACIGNSLLCNDIVMLCDWNK